jgi:sulfite exporter TauE/SafE
MLAILTGFLAGSIHVFTGPDHLAAIAPLSLDSKRTSWQIGMRWGIGHTTGVFFVGAIALLLREFIHIGSLSSYSERFVGIVLIGIGLWGFYSSFNKKVHNHEHSHNGSKHIHLHYHSLQNPYKKPETHKHTHTALSVGVIHGLAGSSHLFGILPALAFSTKIEAALYLLFFGLGTIAAMIIFSSFMGYIAFRFEKFKFKYYQWLLYGFSGVAVCIGVFWLTG